jgi:hypothetical protein
MSMNRVPERLETFSADYYRRPSAFDLMTKNDAGWFFFLLLAVALIADFCGWLA